MTVFIAATFHVNYWGASRRFKVEVDEDRGILRLVSKSCSLSFSVADVSKITKVCTPPVGENRMAWSFFDLYYYFRVDLVNGDYFLVTCFMTNLVLIKIGDVSTEIDKQHMFVLIPRRDSRLLNCRSQLVT
jgi:hypothetical protein